MVNQLKMAELQSITALMEQGGSQRRIARELGIDRETVVRYSRRWRELAAKPANLHPGSELGAEAQDPLLAGLPNCQLLEPSSGEKKGSGFLVCWF